MSSNKSELHRLVSLTFDENPKVRKDAAKALAQLEDPAAIFALMELNYDKDNAVKKLAQDLLKQRQNSDREVMSFAELFGPHEDHQPPQNPNENPEDKKKRILQPIEQLFEKKLGKQRADAVKSKMMPTIEKVYFKAVDPKAKEDLESGRKAMQEFLTSYLEAISDLNEQPSDSPPAQSSPSGLVEQKENEYEVLSSDHQLQVELETVGSKEKNGEVIDLAEELHEVEREELKEEKEDDSIKKLPQTFFKKAYETMMLSGGDDSVLRKEFRRLVRDMEKDAKLAFTLARKKFRETKITNLTKIKDGIRNLNTEIMFVKGVENIEYVKGRSKKTLTRILVNDERGDEAVIYIFDGRGEWLREGMNIKVVRGYVKSFEGFGETAITIGKKGNIYIVI
ncbi:hypothetical protein HYT84_01970 [Candidatus Micrarchaeota archaeon]|nr:hypothetical protein [Candidatus Micrarchaeota archaeon]